MSNRTAAIACAVITGCVSIFGTSVSATAAPAAETAAENECLSAPKGATPAGAHWYYRIEKGTKRKCWYLADEVGKTKKAVTPAPASSDTAEEDTPPPKRITPAPKQETAKKPIQKSVANARAELTANDPSLAETTWPQMPSPAAADVRADNQVAAIQPAPEAAAKQSWNVATRWPEPNASASASDQPAAATPAPAQPAPVLTAERLVTAAAPTPAPHPAAVATATPAQPQQATPPADTEGLSLRILLSILVCVLALAAIVGPLLFKYFRPRPHVDERSHRQRRQIWDLNESDHTLLQDNPAPTLAPRYAHTLPEPRMLDVTTDEIEELLARVSKRSVA
ncbi:hypothetical protein [Afipia broomeae]|nr:hypothetical protein [Afipia broomeae]